MSDPRTDFFASDATPDAPPAAPDPRTAFFSTPAAPQVSSGPSERPEQEYGEDFGAAQMLGSGDFWRGAARGAVHGFVSATAGNQAAADREAQDISKRWGLTGGQGTPYGMAGETMGGFAAPVPGGPKEAAPLGAMDSAQSISAAAATPNLARASPELRAAYQEAQQTAANSGGRLAVDNAALARHVDGESLPVPVRYTEGQATQDPALISQERNARGKIGDYADRFAEQDKALQSNLQSVRDNVGERVFSTTPAQHGDTLIDAYKAKDAAAQANIDAKYQALRDANGGEFPVDAGKLLSNTRVALRKQLLTNHAPSSEMGELTRMADEGMNFEDFEALRTNLARVMRSSSDGNERAAAGIMRQQMEELPLAGGSENLKPLADQARQAARAHFQELDADPAYKAAVNDTVTPDNFVHRFVTGPSASRDGVATMSKNLADNETAAATMRVATVDVLRDAAVKSNEFSQAGFNKAMTAMQDKLPSIFDAPTRETLETVGRVAKDVKGQPAGSFVNNSNTTVAAQAAPMAKNLAEQAVNAKTFGVGGTLGRKLLEGRAAKAAAQKSLAPGAGILRPVSP